MSTICLTYLFNGNNKKYKQHEEQYIINPHDVILFNYGASIPIPIPISRQTKQSPTISLSQQLSINKKAHIDTKYINTTYELIYQKGKVIALVFVQMIQ